MEEKEDKGKKKHKKQKHKHPNIDQGANTKATKTTAPASSDFAFKPSSEVKGLRFGGQFIVKSFTIRRARPLELLRVLSFPPTNKPNGLLPFPSTTAFLPTNFTILAHHAWHTLTLGLGTKKSKVLMFVFESESLRASIADRSWPHEIPLGEVNRRLIRHGLEGCELARFKFRKGCVTFYVYAVRHIGIAGFSRAEDLRTILQSVVELKDFLDHTAMLAMPDQRSINFCSPPSTFPNNSNPFAMAH
ncbi:uncharacterized protein LOC116193736 [Punica granatum]|uniref:DUF7851 domain-containing protein n=2 Tax=Punica granatum TaxID=22663 RepID=A0A218WBN9_PUNGR|nr:uncharacterized protein LOC116193736 [Punica granatum]OWM70056.1 hypothetical protein CDL15_Pgr025905 [Punica granatum]PKI72379.1 hypothetical protein CRG98_007249 [Punica granatum]